MKIGIVNYSLGNVGSVISALNFYRYNINLVDSKAELKNSDLIVLAGVGNFLTAVDRLHKSGLWQEIDKQVTIKKKPILGICLGMQLFSSRSFEGGENKGFGWIKGEVKKIEGDHLKLPHMGWNEVTSNGNKIFKGMRYNYFYFMHSYHFLPTDKETVIATTKYFGKEIVSAVRKDNIIGVQFHPEKSQGDGLRLLRNVVGEFK